MKEFAITVADSDTSVASRAQLADGHLTRMRGLLGRRHLDAGQALILRPCWSIHTWFMRFPLDVAFADADGKVLKVVRHLKPWRFAAARGAAVAIEFEAGALDPTVAAGTSISFAPVQGPSSPDDRLVRAPE